MNDIQLLTQTADFIVKYGFLAVGLVLIVVIAPVIYKFSGAKLIALATLCFGLAFMVAYGVLGILSVVAPSWISTQRVLLSGVIRNVPNGNAVQVQSDLWRLGNAYTKRELHAEKPELFNFPFILVTTSAPSCLDIALPSTDRNAEGASFAFAPISDADMGSDSQLVIEFVGDLESPALKVWREKNEKRIGQAVTLQPLKGARGGCAETKDASWSLFTPAFAMVPSLTSDKDIIVALQSDDVFVRRSARLALSKKTEDGLALIASLVARDDNYRLQLGAVVALADVPLPALQKAPPGMLDKLRSLRGASDKTMRDAAAQALREAAFCYQEININRKPEERYIALCHWTKEQCEKTRGPNTSAGVTQTACTPVQLAEISWKYTPGGTGGAWYQYSPTLIEAPFPALKTP
jgi:hypothetical protein